MPIATGGSEAVTFPVLFPGVYLWPGLGGRVSQRSGSSPEAVTCSSAAPARSEARSSAGLISLCLIIKRAPLRTFTDW